MLFVRECNFFLFDVFIFQLKGDIHLSDILAQSGQHHTFLFFCRRGAWITLTWPGARTTKFLSVEVDSFSGVSFPKFSFCAALVQKGTLHVGGEFVDLEFEGLAKVPDICFDTQIQACGCEPTEPCSVSSGSRRL